MKSLPSRDPFSLDGTLIQAWASMRSVRPEGGASPDPPEPPAGGRDAKVNLRGRHLSSDTHPSTADPGARLYWKGRAAKPGLCCMGHALVENRTGLIGTAA